MWSFAILLLLIGATFANQQNGWTDGKQYTYKINSRTLAAFNQQSKYLSGIIIEAYLTVQPNGPQSLRAKIWQPRYSSIHAQLENGWDSEIPQDLMNLQTFPLSGKSFEIKTKNGVVRDLIVDKDVPTWEVNVLKSIVGQLQVDTQGENAERSKYNQFPEGDQPYAMFKSMEDSVGGKCEVLYDISPLPEQVLQNKPELAPMPELREDGDIISLVKTKNYSNCEQRTCYHFNINGRNAWEPGSNENKKYLARSSVSRVIISGNLRRYTIQSSVTTNKVVHHADRQENQQGMVVSKMNLTLHKVEDISEQVPSPTNPQSTGNLVYNYNSPIDSVSSRRPNKYEQKRRSENKNNNSNESDSKSDSDDSAFDNNDDSYLQPKPKLMEAPQSPLLPFFIGNNGNSILKNNKIDAVKSAMSIAQQIGNEMQNPDVMFAEQTLEKFTILSTLIRTMNAEQIASVQRSLYEQPQSSNQLKQNNREQLSRRNAWVAFRDAVAQAGTGPALVNVKQWIQNKQMEGSEASHVIDTLAKAARTPTPEYMDTYYELVKMNEVKQQSVVRDAAVLSFADLIRHAVVNRRSAHNRYPVHAFGRLLSKNFHQLHEKYIPYMEEELQKAVYAGDSKRIQTYIIALGKTAHPRMLSVFEPYLEGKKQISLYQRLVMVLSLNKLATIYPKVARSVLYKIYSNTADHHEIRTAAVYLLMQSNPSASMLQRMAEFTNYDTSKYVNSAVKSTIGSLAQLRDVNEYQGLIDSARSAQPMLTSESYGPQYSQQMFFNLRNPLTQSEYFIQASTIGSEDSIIPKGMYVGTIPTYNGVKMPKLEFGGEVSSLKILWNFVQQRLSINQRSGSNEKSQEQKYSPENLAKLVGIYGDDPEQIEGFAFINEKYANHFLSYDNHTLEKIPEMLRRLTEDMKQGKSFEVMKLKNFEVTISFPTETGFPFHFTMKNPTITSINGISQLKTSSGSDSRSEWPKSASVSGKVRIVYGLLTQKRLGFVTPFEHQEYIVGIDKDMQLHLPIHSEIEYDKIKRETRLRIQPNEEANEFKVLQYRTQPFTSKRDILNLEPVTKDANTATVHKNRATSSHIELNDNNNRQRLQFNWEKQMRHLEEEMGNGYNKRQNAMEAICKLTQSILSMFYLNSVDSEYQQYSIKVSPSREMSAEMKISYDSMITENDENTDRSENWSPNAKTVHFEKGLSEQERKQTLLKEATKNINSAEADAVDISLRLNGDIQSSLALTAAFADSNVDQKSRALFYASVKTPEEQDYHISVGFEGKNPNVESLDFEETLKANTHHEYDVNIHYGKGINVNNENSQNRIKIQGEIKQTEERKKQIRQSHDAQKCIKQQNLHGDKMTSACKRIKKRATLVNAGDFTIKFQDQSPMREIVLSAWDAAERMTQSLSHSWKNRMVKGENDKVKITFEMSPNDEKVDVTVKTPEGQMQLNNIKVALNSNENNGKVKDNRNKNDEELNILNDNICQLDKTQAITFDSHRYPLQLGSCWHIAMTPYPKYDPDTPSQKLQIPEDMRVSVLTRENENGQKELKITLGESLIELSATGLRQTRAKVNSEEVNYSKHKSYKEKKHGKVAFELFELPDKSLKLVSKKYDIEIVYDGCRAQIETGERYRDSVRGLCGNNDGEPMNDQQTPKGCLLQKPEEFSATYALTNDDQCQGPAVQNVEKAKRSQCTYQTIRPGNVISEKEAGRENEQSQGSDDAKRCITHRTKVIRSENEICFSLRPVPTCSSKCRPSSMKNKAIQLHCVAKSSTSEKVAERVEKGANPDLMQKSVSKTVYEQLPVSCKA